MFMANRHRGKSVGQYLDWFNIGLNNAQTTEEFRVHYSVQSYQG